MAFKNGSGGRWVFGAAEHRTGSAPLSRRAGCSPRLEPGTAVEAFEVDPDRTVGGRAAQDQVAPDKDVIARPPAGDPAIQALRTR